MMNMPFKQLRWTFIQKGTKTKSLSGYVGQLSSRDGSAHNHYRQVTSWQKVKLPMNRLKYVGHKLIWGESAHILSVF